MGAEKRIKVLACVQIRPDRDPIERAILLSLKTLAQRCVELQRERDKLEIELDAMVTAANPGLRAAYAIGPDTAAQLLLTAGGNPERLRSEAAFAALCGVSPIPASSGKVTRHRLSRGGDRAANSALYRIALVRMSSDQRTKDYVARQRQAGRSTAEIMRLLKRAIAREVFRYLSTPVVVPAVDDLRPLRQSKNITLTTAANEIGVWPITISELERGIRRDDDLAQTYRAWLTAA
ncbi:MAG: IS110 family transposase [Nocardioides sp.]|uniref:transposase n=1 Tax=Nocardioides sp. TaxID=35761 RepID=UPI0039E68B63